MEQIIGEIEILKSLDHPNILKLYECYEDEKNYYLISEYCSGGELFNKITTAGRFPNEQLIAKYLKQILSGLSYLHSK